MPVPSCSARNGGRGGRPAASRARFSVSRDVVLPRALFVQIADGALRVNGGPHAARGMPFVRRGRAPKRHDTIADIFVERAAVFLHRVGDGGQIEVHRFERFLRGLLDAFVRRLGVEFMFVDEIRHALLHFIGQRGEPADVRKKNGHLAAGPAEGKFFRTQQFVHHIRRNNFGEDGFDAALFALLKHHAIGDQTDMLHQYRSRDGKHHREPIMKFHEDIKTRRGHKPPPAKKLPRPPKTHAIAR